MQRRARITVWALPLVAMALVARNDIAQLIVTFHTPHAVRAPTATLGAALARDLDAEASKAKLSSAGDLVALSLRTTAGALHFGLGHRTRLSFDTSEREGNCVEYAELFATIYNRERGSLSARAWVVRSDARILGQTVPDPAWKDHDWVLVVVRTNDGDERIFVDPTLYDMGMGWDVSRAVKGKVRGL